MRKTTPGIDRIQMQTLRAQVAWLDGSITKHVHLCHQCSNSDGDVYAMCSKWWSLAKQLHKLRRQLRRHAQTGNPDQMTLPGMDV